MTRVVLQPFGSRDGREHYESTIEKKVAISTLAPFLDPSLEREVRSFFPAGEVAVWGVTPGVKNVNVKKWENVRQGDIVLFSSNKIIRVVATVVIKFRNRDAAHFLWGENDRVETWEYMYLLDEIQSVEIPTEEFNRIVGYSPRNVIQGFSVLEENKSELFLSEFELYSKKILDQIEEDEYFGGLQELESLDKSIISNARKEQQFLRKKLFKNNLVFKCGICGRTYPISFLVAAHIKKRALCSLDEKKDWRNIVMPMCKLGCDDVYEKGYINIKEGRVNAIKSDSTDLSRYLTEINGKKCEYWNQKTKKYFEFHSRQNISKISEDD